MLETRSVLPLCKTGWSTKTRGWQKYRKRSPDFWLKWKVFSSDHLLIILDSVPVLAVCLSGDDRRDQQTQHWRSAADIVPDRNLHLFHDRFDCTVHVLRGSWYRSHTEPRLLEGFAGACAGKFWNWQDNVFVLKLLILSTLPGWSSFSAERMPSGTAGTRSRFVRCDLGNIMHHQHHPINVVWPYFKPSQLLKHSCNRIKKVSRFKKPNETMIFTTW